MAEWLYEAGIGENRAALVRDGTIIEAGIERIDDPTPRVGAIAPARLIEKATGRVRLEDGAEALLQPVPRTVPEGSMLTVRITREAIPEAGRAKLAKAVASDALPAPAPDLLARITASGLPVRRCQSHEADHLEAAGWSELLEEAIGGEIAFHGGALRMSPTPAMTLFDVDGSGSLDTLAVRAAAAVCAAIVRHGIGGSIGIDFPTLSNKAARTAVGDQIDQNLPQPFERTAMNGFGFLQIVRRRERASLPELLRADPVGAAARAELRRMERLPPAGPATHIVSPSLARRFAQHPDWLEMLARRIGRTPEIRSAED